MHACKTCGKSEPDVRFAKQDGNNRPRYVCNLCRSAKDRAKREQVNTPRSYVGWMGLCAETRPNWN